MWRLQTVQRYADGSGITDEACRSIWSGNDPGLERGQDTQLIYTAQTHIHIHSLGKNADLIEDSRRNYR